MFYDIFTKLCKENGVSPSIAVEEIGLNRSNITYWKNGSTPKLSTMKLLAEYFNVPLDTFTEDDTKPENSDTKKIYEHIKNIAFEQGMSIRQLAFKAGVPLSTFRSGLLGKIDIDLITIQKIANALNVELGNLVGIPTDIAQSFLMRDIVQQSELDEKHACLLSLFDRLSDNGQEIAIERLGELTKIAEYCKPTEE